MITKSTNSLKDRLVKFFEPYRDVAELEVEEWENGDVTEISVTPTAAGACHITVILDENGKLEYGYDLCAGWGLRFESSSCKFSEDDLFQHIEAIIDGQAYEKVKLCQDKFCSSSGHVTTKDGVQQTGLFYGWYLRQLFHKTEIRELDYLPWREKLSAPSAVKKLFSVSSVVLFVSFVMKNRFQ